MKRIPNNRRKRRDKVVQAIKPELLNSLSRISEGKTPPEIVDAHLAFYDSCNPMAQQVLLKIFKEQENQIMTDICEFFAEKDNAKK